MGGDHGGKGPGNGKQRQRASQQRAGPRGILPCPARLGRSRPLGPPPAWAQVVWGRRGLRDRRPGSL